MARESTLRSSSGCSVIHCWTSRRGSRWAVWAASWALNWAWFPGLPQEHDQVAGDGQCRVPAQVLLDQGEGEIDARGDTGRGGDGSVADVDRVRVDLDGGMVAGEFRAVRPVRGGPATVQEARLGEQDRAGAHGDQSLRARPVRAQPVGHTRVRTARARAAGDEERVRGGRVGEGRVRYDGQAAGGAHRAAVQGGRTDAIGPRGLRFGARENLHGAGDVEALDVVEEDHQDGSHAVDSSCSALWPQ